MNRTLSGCFSGLLTGFGIFILLLGAILFFVGGNSADQDDKLRTEMKKCTEETTATVTHLNIFEEKVTTDNSKRNSTRIETTYDATLTFTVDGQEYNVDYDSRSSMKEGDTFDIKYDPSNPETAYPVKEINYMLSEDSSVVTGFFTSVGKLMIIVGGVLLLLGIILNIVFKNSMRKSHEREMREAQLRHDMENLRRNGHQ